MSPALLKPNRIFLNALTSSLQIAGNAAFLFLLYRFLVRSIGIDRLGVWSLVLATTSVVTLANQGFSTSIVKFVAKYVARDSAEDISILLQTALISVGASLALILVALYPGAKWILLHVLPRASLADAYAILPYAFASLWINVASSILQAGLGGHQLIAECNYVDLGGSALYLLLAFVFVPGRGLLGLGYAQAVQALVCFLIFWILLKRCTPSLPVIPRRWSRSLFREMAGYGAHFQWITVAQATREPVTKALLTKFGGPGMTGVYDMASRLVVTFRELIVQANQVLVPTVSGLHERDPNAIPDLYDKSYRLIFFLAVPVFAFVVLASPVVSAIWLGRYDPLFVRFVALLAAGWIVNVLCNPAYVVDLGTGALRWVSIGCTVTAILNASLGVLFGMMFGGAAVVIASVLSLMAGYAILLAAFHLENRIPFRRLLPLESARILVASLLGALIVLPVFRFAQTAELLSLRTTLALAAFSLLIISAMWTHPMRKHLLKWMLARKSGRIQQHMRAAKEPAR